jgi:NTE family protein
MGEEGEITEVETGLALAGGGVPGIAAVGVLLALEEAGITVSHVAGASSGGMIAALYAYGYPAGDLARIVPLLNRRYLDVDWKGILYKALFLRPRLEGWLKGERLLHLMEKLTHNNALSAMKIPCGIVATDLNEGKPIVYTPVTIDGFETESELTIAEAVRASFAIPVLFQPAVYSGRTLIDGGVTANCPVRICRALGAERVIAIDPITPIADAASDPSTTFQVLHKVIHLNLKLQMELEHRHADLVLYPEIGPIGAFDFHKAERCIEAGYRAASSRMDEIIQSCGGSL